MYGVPKDLNLSFLEGKHLTQISLGEYQVIFNFHPEGSVSAVAEWQLLGPDGAIIDQAMQNSERSHYRIHQLLGQVVTGHEVDPPRSFSLQFSSGSVLRVFDSSKDHESFSIQPGNIIV
jgi:hypothetical protein